ncbi:LysR family transcriptional regulator [Sphingobium sp. LB126]|uniref:LysR family transcriptional regulator n=1 Tax=Sphingobium sp. LB126 TaxID=1983755 RepID=UPI0012FD0D0F|nr:LysR family transcriptional regulator [Sphingobium sp. LB126]
MRSLRATNLNLLPVLRAVLRFKNVTRAARALDLSPSTVSEMLGHLRHMFDDELLVARGKTFRLTVVAERLDQQLRTVLKPLDHLIDLEISATSHESPKLDIAINDYSMLVVGEQLVRFCAELHPEIILNLHDVNEETAIALLQGDLDFLISPEIPAGLTDPQFARLALVDDRMMGLVDAGSPIIGNISEEMYWRAQHIFLHHNPGHYNASRTTILQHIGENRADSILVESYPLLAFLVEGTESIALVLERAVAALMPQPSVRLVEVPFEVTLRTFAYWDDTYPRDPVQRRFVEILRDFASQISRRATTRAKAFYP